MKFLINAEFGIEKEVMAVRIRSSSLCSKGVPNAVRSAPGGGAAEFAVKMLMVVFCFRFCLGEDTCFVILVST